MKQVAESAPGEGAITIFTSPPGLPAGIKLYEAICAAEGLDRGRPIDYFEFGGPQSSFRWLAPEWILDPVFWFRYVQKLTAQNGDPTEKGRHVASSLSR